MNQYIAEYTDFLKIEKRQSLNTVAAYRRDINCFVSYFPNKELGAVTASDVRSFLMDLRRNGFSLLPLTFAQSIPESWIASLEQ